MIDVRSQFPIKLGYPRLKWDTYYMNGIVIHHTAVDPRTGDGEALLLPATSMTKEDELNHIAVIHLYHKSIGFGGFGYHFIVFPSGRAYYVVDLDRWGAHCIGHNNSKPGVCVAGNFIDTPPNLAQSSGVWHTLGFIDGVINPPDPLPIFPHHQLSQTSCPGKAWPLPEQEEEGMTFAELTRHMANIRQKQKAGTALTDDEGRFDREMRESIKRHAPTISTPSIASIADSLKIVKK